MSKSEPGKEALLSVTDVLTDHHPETNGVGTLSMHKVKGEVRDHLNLIYWKVMALGLGILNSYNFLVSFSVAISPTFHVAVSKCDVIGVVDEQNPLKYLCTVVMPLKYLLNVFETNERRPF